jgi:hypothetical protein
MLACHDTRVGGLQPVVVYITGSWTDGCADPESLPVST